MKKQILFAFFTSLVLILSGCGSNDKVDDSGASNSKSVALSTVVDTEGKNFNIRVDLTKNTNYTVTLENFRLIRVNQCTIESVNVPPVTTISGGKGSFRSIVFSGNFKEECTPGDHIIEFSQTISDGSRSKTELVTYNSGATSEGNVGGGLVQAPVNGFFNAMDMNISSPNKPYIIKVQVLENGYAVSGKTVRVKPFSNKYGDIGNPATQTGEDGYARFSYTSPPQLPVGKSITVTLTNDENGTVISQDIVLKFVVFSSDNPDVNVSTPVVVIANSFKNINLTQNSQNSEIEVQVFEKGTNTPYTSGNVRVSLPNKVLEGVDVGSFSKYTVAVGENGRAVFNYTGPQDLKTLIESNDKSATFSFFHENNPAQQENSIVHYVLKEGYIPANYILTTSSSNDEQTMGLKTLKTFTLYLKDDKGHLVDDEKINQIDIISQNMLVGKLVDAANNGSNETTLSFSGDDAANSKSFSIQTYTRSGLLPIKISVKFNDASGNARVRIITMNVVVFSGPPTALSISYAGVDQNKTVAKYIEKFVVTVTDAYNNPVNTRPYVAVGAMVEYAVDGSSVSGDRSTTSPRLWHGTQDARGKLEALGGHKAQLTTTSDVFNYVDIYNDKLVVFGAGYVYEALGKWDIDSIENQVLGLKDDYYGTTRSDLGFAVGHNNRQDLCSSDQREYVGNMKANEYQLDATGHALIEFEYDYHLTGKDMMIWANLTGYQADNTQLSRIGEAQKHTLRGNGLKVIPEGSYSIPKGETRSGQTFAIHHANAPEWYINGKFGWAVKAGSTCEWSVDYSTNSVDARSCYGAAYIAFTLTAPADKDCTFGIERVNTAREFTGVSSH